jgi:hypothetical protein
MYRSYTITYGEQCTMYYCSSCGRTFSETKHTSSADLKTPISIIVQVFVALTEGVGINAATSLYRCQERLRGVKKTLLLFALTQQLYNS